jgi:hypothetical protein
MYIKAICSLRYMFPEFVFETAMFRRQQSKKPSANLCSPKQVSDSYCS